MSCQIPLYSQWDCWPWWWVAVFTEAAAALLARPCWVLCCATMSSKLARELHRKVKNPRLAETGTSSQSPAGVHLQSKLMQQLQRACCICCSSCSTLSGSPEGLPLATDKLADSQTALLVIIGASAGRGRNGPACARGGRSRCHSAGAKPPGGAGPRRNSERPARSGARGACRKGTSGKEGRHRSGTRKGAESCREA